MSEQITAILNQSDIEPNVMVGEQTAFQLLEAAILGALDQIEEEIDK